MDFKVKRLLFPVFALVFSLGVNAKRITVVDGSDGSTLPRATIMSNDGIIVGLTDAEGNITVGEGVKYPITVRYMGFDPLTLHSPIDTVRLKPKSYSLSEIIVSPGERPVTKVVCYIREYCTGTTSRDTMQLFSEYMAVAFGTDNEDTKGFHKSDADFKFRNRRFSARFANNEGLDSVASPTGNEEITFLSFAKLFGKIPLKGLTVTDKMRTGAITDTVPGKYFPSKWFRNTPSVMIVSEDLLADEKDHKMSPTLLKILGMSVDLTEAQLNHVFVHNESGKYKISDFFSSSISLKILAYGKMLKWMLRSNEPVEMLDYIEIYPVEISRLTLKEYKEQRKEKEELSFIMPEELSSLSPVIDGILLRLDEKGSSK